MALGSVLLIIRNGGEDVVRVLQQKQLDIDGLGGLQFLWDPRDVVGQAGKVGGLIRPARCSGTAQHPGI